MKILDMETGKEVTKSRRRFSNRSIECIVEACDSECVDGGCVFFVV